MVSPLKVKAHVFTIHTLHITDTDIGAVASALTKKRQQAPKFFQHLPIIVDLDALSQDIEMPDMKFIEALQVLFKKYQLAVAGYRCTHAAWIKQLQARQLPVFQNHRMLNTEIEENDPLAQETSQATHITQKVRSGQQAIAQQGDLIITAPISHGTELLASGNIHVYGVLRGRAFAGLNGDKNACIFCQKIDVDLVSIAGYYEVFEHDISERDNNTACYKICLKNEKIVIEQVKMGALA